MKYLIVSIHLTVLDFIGINESRYHRGGWAVLGYSVGGIGICLLGFSLKKT